MAQSQYFRPVSALPVMRPQASTPASGAAPGGGSALSDLLKQIRKNQVADQLMGQRPIDELGTLGDEALAQEAINSPGQVQAPIDQLGTLGDEALINQIGAT